MLGSFKDILIPVDFSINTEVAVGQALDLACPVQSTIHLLHIKQRRFTWNKYKGTTGGNLHIDHHYSPENIMSNLLDWKQSIQAASPNTNVSIYIVEGAVQKKIVHEAKRLHPQLIIIGKKGSYKYLSCFNSTSPNGLARLTGCIVLTVVKRSVDKKIKTIVLPVGSFVPKRKIEIVFEFARKFRAEIHLVTIPNRINIAESSRNAFLETYRILKTGLTTPIEHHILKGNNFARAILDYAECIHADMIMVNPWTETKMSSFTGKHIDDMLRPTSKLRVMSVEPYLD